MAAGMSAAVRAEPLPAPPAARRPTSRLLRSAAALGGPASMASQGMSDSWPGRHETHAICIPARQRVPAAEQTQPRYRLGERPVVQVRRLGSGAGRGSGQVRSP